MSTQTVKLEDIAMKNINEVLELVVYNNHALTVQLPNGSEVIMKHNPPLKPLPELEGFVPDNWKDAVYT